MSHPSHLGPTLASDVLLVRERSSLDDSLDVAAQTLGRQRVTVTHDGGTWSAYLIGYQPGPHEVTLSFAADPDGAQPNPPVRLTRSEISDARCEQDGQTVELRLQLGLGPSARVLTITGERAPGT